MADQFTKPIPTRKPLGSGALGRINERTTKLQGYSDKINQIHKDARQTKDSLNARKEKDRFNDIEEPKKRNWFVDNLLSLIGRKPKAKDRTETEGDTEWEELKAKTGGMRVSDLIAPIDLEVDFKDVQVGEWYHRTYFVSGYPRFVGPNWLAPIINFDNSLYISTFYYPVDSRVILKKLKRKIGEMEATLYGQMEDRKVIDPSMKVALTDAQQLQDAIAEGTEKFFHFAMYIMVSAKDKDTLEKIGRNVVGTFASINVTAKPAVLQQEQGLISVQPLGLDKIYITRNMDTTSLATTFPFVSSELTMDHGIMYGINQHNNSLVIFDRFDLENANSVVFAKSGAGKSYFVKLEAIRTLMLGTEIIVIDPDREYEDLCAAVGGSYISFSQDKGAKMNPFELSGFGDKDEDELRMKMLSLQGFFKILYGGLTSIELSILDRAIILTYREKGINTDPRTQRNGNYPLMEDLYKVLKGMAEPEARSLASRLERYLIGSAAGVFNERSTVEINNNFTVFSIRDMPEELRTMVMYLMLDYIWTKVRKERKRRILVVDEAWYMMQNEDSAKFLYSMAKRARKYYLGLTTITQDVEDFMKNDYGKAIITNSTIQMLMKQSPSAVDRLQAVFNLSDGERQFLLTCDKGQGLFFAGRNHVAIQVVSSEAEHELITSDPKELEKRKKDKEAGIRDTRTIEDLSQMYIPPAMDTPIKSGVDLSDKKSIEKAVFNRRKQIEEMIQEKMNYQTANPEIGPDGQAANGAAQFRSLADDVRDSRQALTKGQDHINSQGYTKSSVDTDRDEPEENMNEPQRTKVLDEEDNK